MKYDVWNLVGEYKRSSDLYQLRKTAWKLPTLIPGSVCERVSSLPRYQWQSTLYLCSSLRSRCIPFIKRQVALTLLHVHYRKALALVINLKRFLLALRYLLLRKQNYNVVHTLISPVDWRMFLSTCVVYRQVCQDVGLGKTQLNDYNLKELKEV